MDLGAPITKGCFAFRKILHLSTRALVVFIGALAFVVVGASAIYALVITNQTNTNVVLSYGIWGDTSFDLTADLESATGPIVWSTTGVPNNVSAIFSNATDTGATLTLNQLNNGPNAGNYQMYVVATAQSGETTNTMIAITVQPRAFSIRGSFTVSNKTYDRSTSATIVTNSLTPGVIDVLDGDDVALVAVASFANANAGPGKTVSISASSSLTGAQAGNYYISLSGAPTTTATISPQSVSITPPTFSKTYDRTTSASPIGVPTLNGVLSGDTITISGTPTFTYTQSAVGTAVTVTPSVSYGLSGSAANNYSLTQPTLTGEITPRSLSITFTSVNKTYDGTASASVTASSDTRIAGDDLGTISATSATFTQTGIGTGVTINISGIAGNGPDAANYNFPISATTAANITARPVAIGGTLQVPTTRVYNGTSSATITNSSTLTITNVISSDLPNVSLTSLVAQYATKTVGSSKVVSITSASLSGSAQVNYSLSLTGAPTATANITAQPLTVTIAASNKSYDGTNAASVSYNDDRVSGDTFTISGTAAFDSKSIGNSKTVTATGIALSGPDAANYSPNTSATTSANITSKSLTIGISGGAKTYDGTTAATVTYTDNRISGDNLTISGTANYATKTAATGKTITATSILLSGPDAGNYTYNTTATTTATISTRSLTVGITSSGKTYDRTQTAIVTYTDNRISGDIFTVAGSATYADKTAAINKTITATGFSISGTDAANYTHNTTATTTATITKRSLVVSITSSGKTYDATVNATVTYTDDRISGDTLTVSGTATYANKNAATNKTITATGISISGTDAANYTQNTTATTTATVTQRALTINGTFSPSNKIYDATATATVTPPASPTLSTIQGSDLVSLTGTPSFVFSQASIGTALPITTSGYSLSGTDAGNYTLTLPTISANITTRTLTVGGTLSVNSTKVYDGTLGATFVNSALLTLSNVPAGDSGNATRLALSSPVAQYATKTVGTSKTVSLTSATLSGTSSGNYSLSLTGSPTASANITTRALTITATGINKTYDGTTNATVTLTSDKLGADTVTLAYTTATYTTKIVEIGKSVSVSGISISGADAANYTANTTATTTANISQRTLTVTISATNKTYDAGTSATVTYGSNKIGSDVLNISGTATFANKTVGTSKTVTATSITVTGTDASNYTANTTATTTANITAKPLVVTISASNKVYDGSTTASVTYADDRISGDIFTVSGTPTFATSSVGETKTVTASSISLSGTDAANYTPNSSATTTANITVRTLAVTISGGTKTYDASTAATVTYASNKVAADTLTITGNASFADKSAESNKTITATGISISGTSASNYVLGNTTATTTATISKRVLTISGAFTASPRVYDGTTDATGNVSVPGSVGVTPIQGSDDVTLVGSPTFTYASANVGSAIAITGSGYSISGTDAVNYTLTQLSLSSNITTRTVTIGGSLIVAATKTYDSTPTTSITDTTALTLVNVASTDASNPSRLALTNLVAQYANKNVGDGKIVSITSAAITGTSASNYTLSTSGAPSTTASISLRSLNVAITATHRVYNATTTASVTYSDNRVSGDVFTVSGTANFDSKNFGNGKTVTANSITLSGTDAANYSHNTTATTTANITRRALTVTGTFTISNRQYDATTDANSQVTVPLVAGLSDVQSGDDASLSGTPTFTFARATIGNGIAISTSGYSVVGVDADNYLLTQPSFTANITSRPLTIGGTLSVTTTKVYNRNTAAAITDTSLLTLLNVPAGDANDASKVALSSLTATYNDKNVGIGKTVNVATASLTGTTAANYTITTSGAPSTTADITQRPITLGFTLGNKTYDGTTTASVSFTDNRLSGDSITVSGTPTYEDKNVGTGKTVTATNMSISGTDAPNYSFNSTASGTSSILVRSLNVTITASNKTYDGSAVASVVYADNRVSGDTFTVSGTATFASKTVGTSKTVTASGITLTGLDAGNYSRNTSATTTASISRRALTVTISAANKIYDRTATASVTYSDDRVSGDVLTISSTPTFSDKNVGSGKTVTANSIALSSTDAGNYTSNTTATTTADITKKSLNIGITPSNKVYNANASAAVTYTDNRISGDSLTFSSTNTFSDKNAGTGKTVTASGITVTNADAGNYEYNTTATALANISRRPLTVTGTFTVANRPYDATTDATPQVTLPITAGLSDVQSGDDATLTGSPTFTFAQATIGSNIAISTSGYSVVGIDAENYTLTQPSFTANITTRPLTIGGALVVASTKTYDRAVSSSITDASQLLLQNVPAGDANNSSKVALSGLVANYVDKNVGTGKAVSLTSASLTGATSSNYTLTISGAPTTTADITPRSVTISISPSAKTYDGTDSASVTYQDTRISSDVFTVSGTATFSDKNVGTSKTVTASGIALSGADSGNYTPNTTATNTANITRRTLTVTTTGVNKVYDRTTTATVTFSDNRISGDIFSYSATSTFSSKTVGIAKSISTTGITLSGTDSGNYTPNTTASSSANITIRPLVVSITANNRTYNATTAASVTYLDDRVGGDLFTVSGTASFDNKNIGTAKTVTATSITLSGTDAANYSPNTIATTTADVTVRTLNVTAVADTKMYDANTNATAVYSDDRVSGDVLTVTGTASFTSKTAAVSKTVNITDITIAGTDAANYQQNLTTTSVADITQRPLEVTGTLQAQNKVYDGTRTATYDIADLTLVGVQGSDLVGVTNPRGRFRTDANVGINKIVELTSFQFTGADLGNYAVSVNNSPITYASITPRTLNVTMTASSKTYDGNTNATVIYTDNRVSGDVMTVSGSATFDDKNIGTSKLVTANNITISGTAAGNYTQNTTTTASANITARTLTVTIAATSKTYDGNTNAEVTYADNRVSGDVFTVSGTSTFSNKIVGNGKTVTATGISISGTDASNYTHNSSATTTANITSRSLTVSITASDKVYDRTTSASVVYADNRVTGDSFTVTGTPTFGDKNVGSDKTVTASGISISGTDAANYTRNTSATTTANITPRPLVVTISASNKIYNASTNASVTYGDNRISNDVFTISGLATFSDKNAAAGKTVTATDILLSGTDAANYSPNTTASTTATITKRSLSITGTFSVAHRQYDATADATSQVTLPNSPGLSDVQGGDDTTLAGTPTFTFAQATVGTGISISTSGYSLTGIDADNYSLSAPTLSGDITQRPLTIGGTLIIAPSKIYDRTVAMSIADTGALTLLNVPSGDANNPAKIALASLVAQFSDKTVDVGKTVSLTSASLAGSAASNYTLSLSNSPVATADITPRSLNVTISASHKTYDGTASASVSYSDNRVAGDQLTITGSPSFDNKNVGSGKTVTASSISLSGADAGNYTQNATAITTANITMRSLAVTVAASSKVYDGTTSASVVYSDNRITGDVFTASGTATFPTKTVASSKTVTVSGISLSGTDAGNYSPNTTTTATANITARTLVITANAVDKTYDRTTGATVSISDDRISGNLLTITYSSSTFDTRSAGIGKAVLVSGISVTGLDAINYTYATSTTTTATIHPRTLNVTVTPTNKLYDGTNIASVTYTDNRISGDALTVSGDATFDSKTAVNGKTVTSSNLLISGPDSSNYVLPSLSTSAVTTANISPRPLTITGTFSVAHRPYDATTDATTQVTPPASPGLSDVQLSDDVTLSGTPVFTFAQATVGTNIGITTSGYSLTGADSSNYTLSLPSFSANITQRPLTISGSLITPSSRVYDQTTAAEITTPSALTLLNVPTGDANDATKISLSAPVAAFGDENVASDKTVSLISAGLSGSRLSNYTLSLTGAPTTTANITTKPLAVTITASDKTYDANDSATVTYTDDRITGDSFSVSGTPTFANKNVENAKTVTATGIALTGTDANNYTPNTTATTTANITTKPLTVTITASNKTYDANDSATVIYIDNRITGDVLTVSGTATFANKNVGTTKTVTASTITLTGTDANNYTPNTTATTTANITTKPLTVTIAASNKTYDANDSATVTYTDDRIAGDIFTISSDAHFDDMELGRNKPVTAMNITLSGIDANNYTPNSTAVSSGDITVREITAQIPTAVDNRPLSNATPTVLLGDLVSAIDTTVTFTRAGYASVICSVIPQNATETCTSPTLADGTWKYRARQLIAALMVAASEEYTIVIDTTAPASTRPLMFTPDSDTGVSATDGITRDNTPTVFVTEASPTDRVVVTATSINQSVQCSFTATATEQTCTLPVLSDGNWDIAAVITDLADNTSTLTPNFVGTIDTIAPATSVAPFNAQDNGAATSLDATPRISVSGIASGEIATVNGTNSRAEKATCSFIAANTLNYCEMSTMTSGTWSLTATISDVAGNVAAESPPTQIIISAGIAPATVATSAVAPKTTTNKRENVVAVKFGTSAALAGVESVSFIVFDSSGKVIRRSTIKVNPQDTGARLVIPASVKGAKVRVVTSNQCGVSQGAPRSFNVRRGKTVVSLDNRTNIPTLAGQLVLPDIQFGPSDITLDAGDKAQLDKAFKEMKGKCGTLLVSGFARHNNTDTKKYLQNLADFRAQAVADYLSRKGLTMWIDYQGFVIKPKKGDDNTHRRVVIHWTPS